MQLLKPNNEQKLWSNHRSYRFRSLSKNLSKAWKVSTFITPSICKHTKNVFQTITLLIHMWLIPSQTLKGINLSLITRITKCRHSLVQQQHSAYGTFRQRMYFLQIDPFCLIKFHILHSITVKVDTAFKKVHI